VWGVVACEQGFGRLPAVTLDPDTLGPPALADDRLRTYYWMRLTRVFDDRMVAMWKQGRGIGGTFSQRGHEAISVGAALAMDPDDVAAPMHRDLGCYLVRGMAPERIFANLLGRATGPTGGRDANLHGMGDLNLGLVGFVSHLPMSMPVALGAAVAFQMRGEHRAALTFVGDGGSSTGGWHETLNMAAVYRAPLVVVVENNQYAYSTPLYEQMVVRDIADRAVGYGMPGRVIDGNEVDTVRHVVGEALDRARTGGGPTLIEAKTMRMLGHAIHDGAEYVPAELLAQWERRDPVRHYTTHLLDSGVDPRDLDTLDKVVDRQIAEAVAVAEAAPMPDPATVAEGVYAP
jgi:TPP-dependent pyruvate/acetoin dehydrogenase alpha subunit